MVKKTEKKERVTKENLEDIASFINEEHKRRQGGKYRKDHEVIWKEVDRQIAMKPSPMMLNTGDPSEQWESNIELGSLSDASEIIADDVMRIAFPSERDWFKPHIRIEGTLNPETGENKVDKVEQNLKDGVYKSLVSQQHKDFGLRARVKLSVKEALHHGSFVALVNWQTQNMFYGAKRKEITAPVWEPLSMWDCFPDDSPSVIGTNILYDGSMIVQKDVPLSVALKQDWMNLDKVKEKKSKERKNHVTLKYFYGDLYVPTSGKDLWFPNYKCIVCEDWVLIAEENDTPHSPVIYSGYERDDVKDPYYTSPLIKRSPTHKIATSCANKYLDAIALRTFPPIGYDSNEPTFRANGGPRIAPNESFALRNGGQMKPIEVADPTWALQGLQLFKQEVEEGTGVNSIRKGSSAAVEQTAYEVSKMDQKSEIRTIDFVFTLESQGLLPFLYMQHELNKQKLESYSFYNTQLNTPDFVVATGDDLKNLASEVHFEVVGSKGVLGEERRRQGMLEVTGFFGSNELFAPLLNTKEIMLDAYRDVGAKDPERYLNLENNEDPRVAQITQQAQEAIAQLQQELQDAQLKAAQIPLMDKAKQAQLAEKDAELGSLAAENKMLEEQIQLINKQRKAEQELLAIKEEIVGIHDAGKKEASDNGQQDAQVNKQETAALKQQFQAFMKFMVESEKTKQERNQKIKQFIVKNGSDEAKEVAREL